MPVQNKSFFNSAPTRNSLQQPHLIDAKPLSEAGACGDVIPAGNDACAGSSAAGRHLKKFMGILALALAMPALCIAQQNAGASFPDKPIKLIVPRPPGGAADGSARVLAQEAAKQLGTQIIIENKSGAAGTLGPALMAKTADPDGYTISLIEAPLFRVPHMEKVTYDPVKGFTHIIGLAGYTFGILVRPDSPIKNFDDLVRHVKANPGKVSYGSVGVGSTQHLGMGAIGNKLGLNWLHVPFKGTSENLQALMGGHVDFAADSSSFAPFVDSGKLRLIVTFGSNRTKRWPTVPNLRDVGVDLAFDAPIGISGPAGMPPARVKKIHDAFKTALDSEAFEKLVESFVMQKIYMNSEDFTAHAKKTSVEDGLLIKSLGLSKSETGK